MLFADDTAKTQTNYGVLNRMLVHRLVIVSAIRTCIFTLLLPCTWGESSLIYFGKQSKQANRSRNGRLCQGEEAAAAWVWRIRPAGANNELHGF